MSCYSKTTEAQRLAEGLLILGHYGEPRIQVGKGGLGKRPGLAIWVRVEDMRPRDAEQLTFLGWDDRIMGTDMFARHCWSFRLEDSSEGSPW